MTHLKQRLNLLLREAKKISAPSFFVYLFTNHLSHKCLKQDTKCTGIRDTQGKRCCYNTGQHCSCRKGHLAVREMSQVPSPSPASWPPQFTLGPLSVQTTQHDSAKPISLIQPHPCVDTIPWNASPQVAHKASWCKIQPAQRMAASIKASVAMSLENEPEKKCWDLTSSTDSMTATLTCLSKHYLLYNRATTLTELLWRVKSSWSHSQTDSALVCHTEEISISQLSPERWDNAFHPN